MSQGSLGTVIQQVGIVDSGNSSTDALDNAAVFTGTWIDVSNYTDISVAVKTDQNGTYSVQYSPDASNVDSTLTRYYRTDQIEPPHVFKNARQYMRVVFTNNSGSNQTYFRLQTMLGNRDQLNAPLDSTMAQDYDSISVRPSDYKHEVALGRRQGSTLWNKFGYNTDVDTGTEVVASWGGTFTPMTTARTLSIVSTSTADDDGSTGANSVIVYGIDANREAQTVVVTMDGTTPVVTTETWLGVNRIAIYISGSGQVNAGTITATATTDATTQGQIPAGEGTSQQCIFFTQANHQALAEWLSVSLIRFGSGTEPLVTLKAWVYSAVSGSKYEVARMYLDASLNNHQELIPPLPFPVGEQSCFWLEATTTRDNTSVNARFSLIEHKDADA